MKRMSRHNRLRPSRDAAPAEQHFKGAVVVRRPEDALPPPRPDSAVSGLFDGAFGFLVSLTCTWRWVRACRQIQSLIVLLQRTIHSAVDRGDYTQQHHGPNSRRRSLPASVPVSTVPAAFLAGS